MSTPSTTPPSSDVFDTSFDPPVVVKWSEIDAKWDKMKQESVLDTVDRFISEARDRNASTETVTSLCVLRTNLWLLHFGGHEAMQEKK